MNCENEFCIYQKNNQCILNEIELDTNGNCMSCIYMNISKKMLKDLKDKTLRDMEREGG